MTENISTYIKELKNIEKNGDRDLTTKYDHLYHIINQSKEKISSDCINEEIKTT